MHLREHKLAIVTGANTGLGFQTAARLAAVGVTVVMACRSPERAERARQQLAAAVPGARLAILPLDLADLSSVQSFCRVFAERFGQLHLLVNNAGIVGIPLSRTRAGHELQLATNYLGPFALTGTLLPLFRTDASARIVNVGSLAQRLGQLRLDDFNWQRGAYNTWAAYARSKLALHCFTMELNRRLRKSGKATKALGAHPGFAATDIGRYNAFTNPRNPVLKWFNERMRTHVPTTTEAADIIVHAACSADVQGGDYLGPSGWLEIRGRVGRAKHNPAARDVHLGKQLWAQSEAMTGVRFLSDV